MGRDWIFMLLASFFFLLIAGCLIAPLWGTVDFRSGFAEFIIVFLWMVVFLVTPLRQLTRRLGFVVLGVLTLVGLSEISKHNLHQYLQPPKVSDNLVR